MPSFYGFLASVQATVQHQISRSAAFIGDSDFSFDFDDLVTQSLGAWNLTGPGSIDIDLTHGPGVRSIPNLAGTFMGKDPVTVADGSLTPWHVAARLRLPTVFAPDDDFGIMLAEDATLQNFVRVGTHWNVDKEKFVFEVCQAGSLISVLSDVFVEDQLFHDLELWFDGTRVYGSVDDAEIKAVAAAVQCPTTRLSPYHGVIATNNVGGSMALVDWLYSAGKRTPG